MDTMARLDRKSDVAIVQVTHLEAQARYGERIVALVDGRVVDEPP